jgi:drug/metabolite transporter (DMT)-like permease
VLPLAQVFALEFTTPFWVMVLAPLVLGEALTKNRILAALVGFIGILVVTRPNPSSFEIGQLAAAAAAIGFAASAVFTRLLTRRQSVTCILFWLTVMQAIFGLICAGFDGQIRVPSTESLPWVVVIALAGLLAHYCITTALSLAPASVVIPVDFARLPIIAIVGMIFYHEPFEVFVLLGALIIFGANYANIRFELREKPVT